MTFRKHCVKHMVQLVSLSVAMQSRKQAQLVSPSFALQRARTLTSCRKSPIVLEVFRSARRLANLAVACKLHLLDAVR